MQPRRAARAGAAGEAVRGGVERGAQLVDPGAGDRRHGHGGHARQQLGGLLDGALGVGDVGLRDRDHAVVTPSAASTAACSRVCGITPSSAATVMR